MCVPGAFPARYIPGKFSKSMEELTSRMDQWMFLFNHLHRLTEPVFTDDPIFQKLFQVTEFSKLKLEDQMIVIDRERDMRNIENRWRREAREEARKEALRSREKFVQEGRLEGERHKTISFARTLISDTDFSDQKIAELTGLEEKMITGFRNSKP